MCVLVASFACIATSRANASDGVVSPPNCNESGFANTLAAVDASGGGTLTFNCGSAATIVSTYYKSIAHAVIIDGADHVTFDGGNAAGFLQIYFSANVTLKRLTLQKGAYSGGVRALENFGALTLDHVRVVNNASTLGPLLNSGMLDVRWSTFSSNAASAATADGGAIENAGGTLRIRASTFNGNSAGRYGGAIYSEGPLDVVNATFNANHGTAGGGAIYQSGSGASHVDFATLVGNTAPFGAGLYNDGGASSTLTIARSIVAANATGNCDGVLLSGGYNLGNDSGCGGVFTGPGDLINQTLAMGALANNGGPTATMLPQAGNPAINHVPNAQCPVPADQRGGGRPNGAGCDSGAVEVGAAIDLIFYDGFD